MEMRENTDDYKLERWLAALLSLLFLLPFVADGQEIKEGAASPLVTMDQVQQGDGRHPDHRRADQASSRGENSFEEARTEGRRRSLDDTRGEEH